jgi:hypothetical protein
MPRKDVNTWAARYTTRLIYICRRILSICHVPSQILSCHNCRNGYCRTRSYSQYYPEFGQNNHAILYMAYDIIIQYYRAPPLLTDIYYLYPQQRLS